MRHLRVAAIGSALVYLLWRAAFTWAGSNPILFVALLCAEAFGVVRLWVELQMSGPARPAVRRPDSERAGGADVIVFVTDEPASEVRSALLSASAVQGCESVVVADLTNRPDVARLAERLEISRLVGKGDAGTLLTRALKTGSAPHVVVLPAEVVVLPDIVTVTASAFDDPEVGVVVGRIETTHAAHAIDHGGYGEDRLREIVFNPTLDDAHALPWWHGVSVIRRQALEEIGGFVTAVDRPTLATGVRMQVGGWRMADVPVLVARRLAAWTESRHIHRWARDLRERLELLMRRDVSWSSTKLTVPMRLAYRHAAVVALRGPQRLVLFAVLFATLFGLGLPLVAPAAVLVPLWSLRMGLGLAARLANQRRTGVGAWVTNDLRLLTTELVVLAEVIGRRRGERDLSDSAPGERARAPFLLGLQAVLFASLALFGSGVSRPPHDDFAMLVILLAAAWGLVSTIHARSGLRLRQSRQGFRAVEQLPVLASQAPVTITGVSPFGVDVVCARPLVVGSTHRIAFELPRADGSSVRFSAATSVKRCSETPDGRHASYLRFAQMSDEEMDQLLEYCSIVAGQRSMRGPAAEGEDNVVAMRPRPADPTRDDDTADSGEADIVQATWVGARAAKGNGL